MRQPFLEESMGFLSLNNPIGRAVGKAFDLAVLNVLFIVTCIPVFTIGTAVTSLYQVMLKLVKDEEGSIVKGYFGAFKENFKKATLCFIPISMVFAVLLWNLYWYAMGYLDSLTMKIAIIAGLVLLGMIAEIVFVWQARFINSIREIWHNAIYFVLRYFFVHLMFMAITLGWLYIMIFVPGFWIVGIGFAFSLPAFTKSFFYRRKMQIFEDMIHERNLG